MHSSTNVSSSKAHGILPSQLFHEPELGPDERRRLYRVAHNQGERLARRLHDPLTDSACTKVKRVDYQDGVTLLEENSRSRAPRSSTGPAKRLRATCSIQTSLRDFIQALSSSILPGDMDDMVRGVQDTFVIAPLGGVPACKSIEGPQAAVYTGINWFALPPSDTKNGHDFVLLQYQDFFTHHGRRGWVQSMRSMDIKGLPSVEQTHDYKRSTLYESGVVAMEAESDPDTLIVTFSFGLRGNRFHMNASVLEPLSEVQHLSDVARRRVMRLTTLKKELEAWATLQGRSSGTSHRRTQSYPLPKPQQMTDSIKVHAALEIDDEEQNDQPTDSSKEYIPSFHHPEITDTVELRPIHWKPKRLSKKPSILKLQDADTLDPTTKKPSKEPSTPRTRGKTVVKTPTMLEFHLPSNNEVEL